MGETGFLELDRFLTCLLKPPADNLAPLVLTSVPKIPVHLLHDLSFGNSLARIAVGMSIS